VKANTRLRIPAIRSSRAASLDRASCFRSSGIGEASARKLDAR
jgi:hypothetical protein